MPHPSVFINDSFSHTSYSMIVLIPILCYIYKSLYESWCFMIKNKWKTLIFLGMFCLGASAVSGCEGIPASGQEYSQTGTYFDTVITLTLYNKEDAKLLDDCFQMADHYEELFSRTIETSDISRINDADGDYVTVDEDTIELLEAGLKYCELSDGKFDITVGRLSDLWDFQNNTGEIPDPEEIREEVSHVDYHNVKIKGDQAALTDPEAELDLGGIAKGFIADKMKEYLTGHGVESGMINLGGNVLVIGSKPDGSAYQIGIEKPFAERNVSIAALSITDQTVVSSGIYERYFEKDGKIYHHILDTSTGYPIENNLYSVTIICDSSTDGDGLSTTCFALGLDAGMDLIESLDHTEAVFITSDMQVHKSSGIGNTISFRMLE